MTIVSDFKLEPVWCGHKLPDRRGAPVYKPDINGTYSFAVEVWIDGTRMEREHAVDVFSLLRSVHEPIERYRSNIFTCGCGEHTCAGIIDGVTVTHHGRYVFWNFRTPLKGGFGKHSEADWVRDSKPKRLRFLRSQLIHECGALLAFALNASGNKLDACKFATVGAPATDMLGWIKHKWVRP